MHIHSPICHGQLKEKIRPITLILWVLGRVKKMPKKGLFKNLVYRSVALVAKFFFLQAGPFFRPVHYPINKKKC